MEGDLGNFSLVLPACSVPELLRRPIPLFSKQGCVIYLHGTARTRPTLVGGQPRTLLPLPDLGGPKRGRQLLADCCGPSCQLWQQAMDTTGLKALSVWAPAASHSPPAST